MTIDIIFSGVTSWITSYTTESWSLPYSDIVDQECIGHREVGEIDVLPVIRHSAIEDLGSALAKMFGRRSEIEDAAMIAQSPFGRDPVTVSFLVIALALIPSGSKLRNVDSP